MVPVTQEEYRQRLADLIERRRAVSLWFLRPDYLPRDRDEELRTLDYIEKRSDRPTFIETRELREWLLRKHIAKSAV